MILGNVRLQNLMVLLGLLMVPAVNSSSALIEPVTDARPISIDSGAARTWQLLKKLHSRGSLLMIVAHPDDEDGGTLTYESRALGIRTEMMTLNRGEGGANIMSSDLWDALGLVRTEELLQADRYYGLDGQYFSAVVDYGYSKSLKEALGQWGHDRMLEEAVRVVRIARPLVVTSVFVGGPTDGHGNHATAGMLAQEVFKAAGDPKMFPEQIRAGLMPWTPLKVYARVPVFRTSEKGAYDYATHQWGPFGVQNHVTGKWEAGAPATSVSVPVGTYDSLLGRTYLQISREGLGLQKSQNGGADVPPPAEQASNYHRFGSHIPAQDQEASFFDGIDISVAGIANLAGSNPPDFLTNGLRQINDAVESAMAGFSAQDPSSISATLVKGLMATDALISAVEASSLTAEQKYSLRHELAIKQEQFRQALQASLGVSVEADIVPAALAADASEPRGAQETFQMAVPGQNIRVRVHLFNGGKQSIGIDDVALKATSGKSWSAKPETQMFGQLGSGKAANFRFSATVPGDEPFTRPYFTRPDMEQAHYDLSRGAERNLAFAPYPLAATVRMRFDGAIFDLANVVQVISMVTGPGVQRFPMPVGPPVSVTIKPEAGIVPLGQTSFPVSVRLRNNLEGATRETVHLELPSGWSSTPQSSPIDFKQAGEERTVNFTVNPGKITKQAYQITAAANYAGKSYREGYSTAGYMGLRPYFLYRPATYKIVGTDVKTAPSQNIAYIQGSGDEVPAALEALGLHLSYLSPQDLAGADLSKYDSIIVGVRAYAVRPDLIANNARLLKYAEDGGVVMVQYQTPEFDHNFGPYPYVMTDDPEEVTDEKSVVTILDPKDPILNWPNAITPGDFDGWIEERGSKFLSSWDARYKPLLETHDEGQSPQKGGLVYARYGKGIYIYNAYAFYRQLPLGVPGAYRIIANLLSLPKNPQLHAQK